MRRGNVLLANVGFVSLTLFSTILPTASPFQTSSPKPTPTPLPSDILLPGIEAELPNVNASPVPQQYLQNGPYEKIPVLMYHYIRVVTDPNDPLGFSLSITPPNFITQVQYLSAHKFHTITPQQMYDAVVFGLPLPSKPVLLTFDDGYDDFFTTAWPILKAYNLQSMIFIPTDLINTPHYMTWDELQILAKDPSVTIAGHTRTHANLSMLPLNEVEDEIIGGRLILQQKLGVPVDFFAYPYGAFNDQVISIVKRAGYLLGFSTIEGNEQSLSQQYFLQRLEVTGNINMTQFEQLIGQ